MPDKQLITSIEDRQFQTGPGNWTGDRTWSDEPLGGHDSYLMLEAMTPPQEINTYLNYPHIKPKPNTLVTLSFLASIKFMLGQTVLLGYYLGDGVFTYGSYPVSLTSVGVWYPYYLYVLTPPTWNTENAFIRMRVWAQTGNQKIYTFDNFSLTTPATARIDHLPLVGVA